MRRLIPLLPAALVLAACGGGGSSSGSNATTAAVVVKTVQISEKEFSLSPTTVNLSKTGTYEFVATNNGTVPHAFEIEGNGVQARTGEISPGSKMTLKVTLAKKGTYQMFCPIDGHKAQGMKGTIALGAVAGGTTTTGQTTTSSPGY